jgi:hypothetical protein
MEKGGFQNNPLMKLTIGLTLVFITGLWVTNLLLYFSKMNVTPQSVISYYRGSEIDFIPARTYQSMLEVTHFHLPMIAIVVLLLTHLLIFAPFSNPAKVGFIVMAFLAALLNEASSWLVRFASPSFAYLKIGSFLLFEGMVAFLIVSLAWFLWRSPSRKL